MKTKTIELYTFEELPEDIQAKVLDNERYINVDGDYWYDYDGKTGFNSKEIKKYHLDLEHSDDLITYKKIYFDLDRGWYIQFVDAEFKHDETARRFLGVPKALWNRVDWTINDTPGRETNTRLEWELMDNDGYSCDATIKQAEILDRAVERFSDKVEEALRRLRDNYEYSTSDEAVKETILANEYTFTIDGKMDNF
jgi:hypothetical protein